MAIAHWAYPATDAIMDVIELMRFAARTCLLLQGKAGADCTCQDAMELRTLDVGAGD